MAAMVPKLVVRGVREPDAAMGVLEPVLVADWSFPVRGRDRGGETDEELSIMGLNRIVLVDIFRS